MSVRAFSSMAHAVPAPRPPQRHCPRPPAVAPPGPERRAFRSCSCGGSCPRCQGALPWQPKLAVSQPGDMLEQEADRVADMVMRAPGPDLGAIPISAGGPPAIQRNRRMWPLNGRVINNSGQPIQVWSDDRGVYSIPAHGQSDRFDDDVDFVQEPGTQQWYKIGANNVTVDRDGHVSGYSCRSHPPPGGACID